MRTISHFSSHNHVFMCVSICVFTCVGVGMHAWRLEKGTETPGATVMPLVKCLPCYVGFGP